MTRRFFSGSTLEQAIMLAARHHGIDPDELDYRRIEKKHGFLRTRRAVVISVDPEHPRRDPGAPVPEPAERPAEVTAQATPRRATPAEGAVRAEPAPPAAPEPAPPAAPEPSAAPLREAPAVAAARQKRSEPATDDELVDAARRGAEILLRFAGVEAEAEARPAHERIEVEIRGEDDEVLLVEGGRGLLAIQHLLPRLLRGLTGRTSFVRVDSGGFHQERKARLQALARREAEAARKQSRSRTLAPMAPDERRIVHMALADDPAVVTESRGSGLRKRIVIRPAGEREETEPADPFST